MLALRNATRCAAAAGTRSSARNFGAPSGPAFKSTGDAVGTALGSALNPTTFQHALGKALVETGVSMERAGRAAVGDLSFWDHTSKHTTKVALEAKEPCVAPDACVAESATLHGDAAVGSLATVAHGAVVYGPATVHAGASVGLGAVVKADVYGAVADGAVVLDEVPAGEYWAGAPAAFSSKL